MRNAFRHAAHRKSVYPSHLVAEIRLGVRKLRSTLGLTLITIAIISVAIASATAVFTAFDSLLLHPIPLPHAEKLFYIRQYSPMRCPRCYDLPATSFVQIRRKMDGHVLAIEQDWPATLATETGAITLSAAKVSPNFFAVLGTRPRLGRLFASTEGIGNKELIISENAWKNRFGSEPNALGRTVYIDGEPYTIVGIIPADVSFPPDKELFATLSTHETSFTAPTARERLNVFGRLSDGQSVRTIQSQLSTIQAQLQEERPAEMKGWRLTAEPFGNWHNDIGAGLFTSAIATLLIVVIAWMNLGSLLAARFAQREREIAVRIALGATRANIAQTLLIESLLIALAGSVGGIAVADWLIGGIRGSIPPMLAEYQSGWSRLELNVQAVLFAVSIALLGTTVVSLVPRFSIPRLALSEALASGRVTVRRRRPWWVQAQIALAVVLLTSAGLLSRSLSNMTKADLGMEVDNVLTLALRLSSADSTNRAPWLEIDAIREELSSIPAVLSVGVTTALPLGGHYNSVAFRISGDGELRGMPMSARLQASSPSYFDALGIPLLAGRPFSDADRRGAPRVALVNRFLARRYFGDANPLDAQISIGPEDYRVIGIVGDVLHSGPSDEAGAEIYVPRSYSRASVAEIAIKAARPTAEVAPLVLGLLRTRHPTAGVSRVRSMRAMADESLAPYRLMFRLISAFAVAALLISVFGLYGLVSFNVTQRSREFGVRLAFGAHPARLQRIVVAEGARIALIGGLVGLLCSLLTGRLLSFLLYGVSPYDSSVLVIVVITLISAAALASVFPARRAARLDPVRSLSAE